MVSLGCVPYISDLSSGGVGADLVVCGGVYYTICAGAFGGIWWGLWSASIEN